MTWLMVAGGAPMVVIVVFGLVALAAAARFAWRPAAGRLYAVLALGVAVLCSVCAGTAADLIAVSRYLSSQEQIEGLALAQILVAGVGESLAPVVLGMGILSLVALCSAVGLRRLAATAA